MKLDRKVEMAVQAALVIATHDDEPLQDVIDALDAVATEIATQRADVIARRGE